jgi:agmatinase
MNFGGILPAYYDVINLLRMLLLRRKHVGFDVIELCPIQDNKASDFLDFKFIYQLLNYHFEGIK